MTCLKCKKRRRIARNLCGACWQSEKSRGTLAGWPSHRQTATHCKRGHEFTPENTIFARPKGYPNGKRQCRTCRRPSKLLADRSYRMLHKCAMSQAEYERILKAQGGVCAVCKRGQIKADVMLAIDHDHACCSDDNKKRCGKCNRGLLCNLCNWALGNAQDSPDRLRALADYLDAWNCRTPVIEIL